MKLHDYQETAIGFLRGVDKCALMMEMGLGKTACVLTALEDRHLPALVVAPKRVAENVWDVERDIWRPNLTLAKATDWPSARKEAMLAGADITVATRDNIGTDLRVLGSERKIPKYRTVIIDELSGYKSHSSNRYLDMGGLVNRFSVKHVWGLTGTPAPNGLHDLWSQISLLDSGKRLGPNITTFRYRYFFEGRSNSNGVPHEWIVKPEAEAAIMKAIQDICLSMSADDYLELPPLVHNRVNVNLNPNVMKLYKQFERNLIVDLEEIFGDVHTADNAAVLSMKLSQLTSGFVYQDVENNPDGDVPPSMVHTKKLDALEEILGGTGDNVIVWYRFTEERDMIMERFPHASTIDERDSIKRWNKKQIKLLVAHPASASHGLNLQHGGHTSVWYAPTWDAELYQQANGRLRRQGQAEPVITHHILADGTIDSRVYQRRDEKIDLQDGLLEFLKSPI